MQRVKLLTTNKYGRVNDVVVMDNNEAFGLIDSGAAVLTKDMTAADYKAKALDEEQANGIHPIVRAHKRK